MGTSRWSPEDWDLYASHASAKSARELFGDKLCSDLNPLNIALRESCDSECNPLSTPIIVSVDVTGSMGFLAETLMRKGLAVLIEEIYKRKPVTDPQVMVMATGDAWYDRAPLQLTQFESNISLLEQLSRFWIEGGGGGNCFESYNLPWYFAATRTRCDAMLKRQRKGYLFTVGDEPPPPVLLASHVKRFFGGEMSKDRSSREVLQMASENWEIFHVMIEQGNYYRSRAEETKKSWQALLGQRAMPLANHELLAELIVSTIQMNEGAELAGVADSWSSSTAIVIRQSLSALANGIVTAGNGVVRL